MFWAGTNNLDRPEQFKNDIKNMVALHTKTSNAPYYVVTVPPAWEGFNTATTNNRLSINAWIEQTYGQRTIPLSDYLSNGVLYDGGFTPTAADRGGIAAAFNPCALWRSATDKTHLARPARRPCPHSVDMTSRIKKHIFRTAHSAGKIAATLGVTSLALALTGCSSNSIEGTYFGTSGHTVLILESSGECGYTEDYREGEIVQVEINEECSWSLSGANLTLIGVSSGGLLTGFVGDKGTLSIPDQVSWNGEISSEK